MSPKPKRCKPGIGNTMLIYLIYTRSTIVLINMKSFGNEYKSETMQNWPKTKNVILTCSVVRTADSNKRIYIF